MTDDVQEPERNLEHDPILTIAGAPLNPAPWPDPTKEMHDSPEFEAVWGVIKTWDINVPQVDGQLYSGATGNHVRAILDALGLPKKEKTGAEVTGPVGLG